MSPLINTNVLPSFTVFSLSSLEYLGTSDLFLLIADRVCPFRKTSVLNTEIFNQDSVPIIIYGFVESTKFCCNSDSFLMDWQFKFNIFKVLLCFGMAFLFSGSFLIGEDVYNGNPNLFCSSCETSS